MLIKLWTVRTSFEGHYISTLILKPLRRYYGKFIKRDVTIGAEKIFQIWENSRELKKQGAKKNKLKTGKCHGYPIIL